MNTKSEELYRTLSALQMQTEELARAELDKESDIRLKYCQKMLIVKAKINGREHSQKFRHTTLNKQDDVSKYIVKRLERKL